jgi:hypothetical protein
VSAGSGGTLRAIRPHRKPGWEGLIDDVAIDCQMLRAEQMADDAFWLAAIVGDKSIDFWLRWNKKTKRLELTVTQDMLGCADARETRS